MSAAAREMDLPTSRQAAEQLLTHWGQGKAVSDALLLTMERLLRKEARLLDQEQYRDWYAMLADDLFYWMPLRENRQRRDKRREIEPGSMAFLDERKADIHMRLQRLESGKVWTEDPAGRQVHTISNVEAFDTPKEDEYEVLSAFIVYRNRSTHDESTLIGRRRDIWRRAGEDFVLARRLILLPQAVLLTKNLSVFF